MDFRKLILIIAASAAVIMSCDKDEDSEVTPYLSGTLTIDGLPEFIAPKQSVLLTADGAEHPDGDTIRYCWKVYPVMSAYDTVKVSNAYTAEFPDSLGTYTIYCYATAEGYSSISTVSYATTVKGGKDGSITGISYPSDVIKNKYYYKTFGNADWTVNNIAEGTTGKGFRNSEVMADVFGRYYSYNDAEAACEALGEGWALPSLEDWNSLVTYINNGQASEKSIASQLMGDASFNGTLMWEYWPAVGEITNNSGFNAIPVGYTNLETESFTGTYEYAVFWTSTSVETDDTMAYYKYLICDEPDLYTGTADKESFGASVRCIRK